MDPHIPQPGHHHMPLTLELSGKKSVLCDQLEQKTANCPRQFVKIIQENPEPGKKKIMKSLKSEILSFLDSTYKKEKISKIYRDYEYIILPYAANSDWIMGNGTKMIKFLERKYIFIAQFQVFKPFQAEQCCRLQNKQNKAK